MPPQGQFNSKSPTIKRILREASELSTSPSPDYTATPLDSDLFEWHFTLRGPPSSEYASGIYHGRIVLPASYPLRPPSFRFLTPSGRFETNREICLSISGHHEETWQPAWGLRTALVALRSFMETDAKGQLGGLECSEAVRRRMAAESTSWKCSSCGRSNEDILKECADAAAKEGEQREDEKVPEELKMGWKDEMGKSDDKESSQLAEGFVQTSPPAVAETVTAQPAYPPARPAQTVPQPTATIPASAPARQQTVRIQRQSQDGVPIWIDRTIAGIVICLVFMVLKMILGY
ncbi:putative ubiquitin-conjugating enzyme protein [Coleophoma crateriformis]|uniref:Putative ubiquitin-conjugating enzyme protein n=1 Tax=Coleophoma crateriformis TaxID=565419 RepID=A0A3D8T952_9HELO|nr:putative ubiquitin-conjugating enzyme protein [Coleophoma crateriformis]